MIKEAYKSFKKKKKKTDLILTATSTVIKAGSLAGTAVFLPVVGFGVRGIVLCVITKKEKKITT